MKPSVLIHSIVAAAKGQVSCDLVDDVAILDHKSGIYYGLNEVAARIWHLIQEPKAVHEIRDILLEAYEVDAERCEQELIILLQALATYGLIDVESGNAR